MEGIAQQPELAAFERRCLERAAAAVADPGSISTVAVLRGQAEAAPRGTALVASWWCAGEGEGHAVLPNPWDDRSGIALYDTLSHEVRRSLTARLGEALDEIHGTAHRVDYWDLLLGPWLADTVTVLLDRRLACLMVRAAAPGAELLLPVPGDPPATMEAALDGYLKEVGSARVLARTADALGVPWREWPEDVVPPPRPAPPSRLRGALAEPGQLPGKAIAAATRSLLGREAGRRVLLLGNLHLAGAQPLRLAARVRGLRWLESSPAAARWLPPDLLPSPELRSALAAGLRGSEGVERVVADALAGLVPLSVLEGYGELTAASRRAYGEACAAVVGAYHGDELRNDFLGRCREAGTGLAFSQHGGGYRQFAVNPVERLERRDGAVFLSWGWEGPGAHALPSPRLSRLRDSHRGGDAVTIVEVVYYLTVLRFASVPLGDQVAGLSRLLADFAEAVADPDVARQLALKRYPAGYAAAVPSDPRLARLDRRRFASPRATDWMRRSRLAVVSYPDTTFIEALAMNVPTIGLWDPGLWELREDAAAPFARLAELGVVHSDPAAAAAKVEEVYRNASAWWAGPAVQEARREFLDRFGRSGDWLGAWSEFLNELARS